MYVPHLLYPFICQWTFRLFPCLAYCKQCCYEPCGACIFLNYSFVQIFVQKWDCWIIWQLYFQLFEEPPYCSPYYFPQCLHQYTFPPTVQECSLFSTASPAFVICRFFFNLFIYFYFWLHWVFIAMRRLFLVAVRGDCSLLQCAGFSWWLLLLQSMDSRRTGFSSSGTWAQQLWLAGSRAQAQQLWCTGLVALQHVGSSQARA